MKYYTMIGPLVRQKRIELLLSRVASLIQLYISARQKSISTIILLKST